MENYLYALLLNLLDHFYILLKFIVYEYRAILYLTWYFCQKINNYITSVKKKSFILDSTSQRKNLPALHIEKLLYSTYMYRCT